MCPLSGVGLKNFGPAIREAPPSQGLRGGMATSWLADDRFSENLEDRTRLGKRDVFVCAGRRSGPKASGAGW